MEKDTTQAKLYEHYLSYFLPEGMLDFFELVLMETYSGAYPFNIPGLQPVAGRVEKASF